MRSFRMIFLFLRWNGPLVALRFLAVDPGPRDLLIRGEGCLGAVADHLEAGVLEPMDYDGRGRRGIHRMKVEFHCRDEVFARDGRSEIQAERAFVKAESHGFVLAPPRRISA